MWQRTATVLENPTGYAGLTDWGGGLIRTIATLPHASSSAMLGVAPSTRFRLGPDPDAAVCVDFDMDHVGPATDGTVFDVFLPRAGGEIDRHHDLFAASIADVGAFILHGRYSSPST